MTTSRRSRPLYRDPDDKMIGGVCSGLGQYFDVDTILFRVGFLVVTLLGGGGVLAYLILWAVLDPAPPEELATGDTAEPPVLESVPDPIAVEDTAGPEDTAPDLGQQPTTGPPTAEPSTTGPSTTGPPTTDPSSGEEHS